MNKNLGRYLDSLVNSTPHYMYIATLILFCIGVVLILVFRRRNIGKLLALLLLSEYTFLIFCTTVFFRPVKKNRIYDLTPFWSYEQPKLLLENIMNVVVFIPVGMFLGFAFRGIRWWQMLMIGVCISMTIEFLQFVLMRGFSEVDDVMHNTLGCLIGCGMAMFVEKMLFPQGHI